MGSKTLPSQRCLRYLRVARCCLAACSACWPLERANERGLSTALPEHAAVVAALSVLLRAGWRGAAAAVTAGAN